MSESVRGLISVLSEEQNVSAVVSPVDSVIKTEPVDTEPSAHNEAEMARETAHHFSENASVRTLDSNEHAVQSAAALSQCAVPSELSSSCEAVPSDAVPQDKMKSIIGDVSIEDASQCPECIPSNDVVQQEDVSVKYEAVNIVVTTDDSMELQHRPNHTYCDPQNEITVTDTLLRHEDQCTSAVLQHDSMLTNVKIEQEAAPNVGELMQEASPECTVVQNEEAPNNFLLTVASDDNSVLQHEVQISDGNRELEDQKISTGIVRSGVEIHNKNQMDSVLSTSECAEVSLQQTRIGATAMADVSAADSRLEVSGTVDGDTNDDSLSLDHVSDNSTESPAVCDETKKPRDLVPAETTPVTIARSYDTLGIDNSQDIADEDSPSACTEITGE